MGLRLASRWPKGGCFCLPAGTRYKAVVQSDEELMGAYAAGDTGAFEQLFSRYAPALSRLMAKDLFRPEDGRDLVQQTFLQLHRHRKDYQLGRPFRPWLYTIALNLKREYFRRYKSRPESELTDLVVMQHPSNAQEQVLVEHRQRLMVALHGLKEEQRDVILLHWLGGLPLPEVAEVVGSTLSAVKVRAHRGYAHMRERLGRLEGLDPEFAGSGTTSVKTGVSK